MGCQTSSTFCQGKQLSIAIHRKTLKVTIPLALITSSRISTLYFGFNLYVFIVKTSGYYEFQLQKTWRRGKYSPSLKLYAFPSDKILRVIADLDCYIERTAIWRAKTSIITSEEKLQKAVIYDCKSAVDYT